MSTRFHLAFPVHDLEKSRQFYVKILGCKEGRSSEHWVDFDFFGHQLVIHFKEINDICFNTGWERRFIKNFTGEK